MIRSSPTPQPALAAYGKLAIGTIFPIRGRIALELGGADALMWEPGAIDDGADGDDASETAVAYLNSRQASIAAGTNEVQRNGISERVLGLPREPSFDTDKPFSEVVRAARQWNHKVG